MAPQAGDELRIGFLHRLFVDAQAQQHLRKPVAMMLSLDPSCEPTLVKRKLGENLAARRGVKAGEFRHHAPLAAPPPKSPDEPILLKIRAGRGPPPLRRARNVCSEWRVGERRALARDKRRVDAAARLL